MYFLSENLAWVFGLIPDLSHLCFNQVLYSQVVRHHACIFSFFAGLQKNFAISWWKI
jgi:hypothetical protein